MNKHLFKNRMVIITAAHIIAILYILGYVSMEEIPIINLPIEWGVVTILALSFYIFFNFYHKRVIATPNLNEIKSNPEIIQNKIIDSIPNQINATKKVKQFDIIDAFKKGEVKIDDIEDEAN